MSEPLAEVVNPPIPLTRQVEEHVKLKVVAPVVELTSTGSDLLDLVAGGGVPWGKMINIVGDKSTGKTLLMSELIACAHRKYGERLRWHYDDAEAGYSFNSKEIWGLDIVAPDDECSDTLEDFQLNLERKINALKDDERLIYVLDSFDSLTSDSELEQYDKKMAAYKKGKKPESGSYGTSKSKGMSEYFRVMKRKIKNKKCLLVVVSQVRENIGVMFGAKYTRVGGKWLDFYAAQIFWLAEAEKHKKGDRHSGITIKARNTKNKIGKPFRECYIEVLFDYGVDNVMTSLMFLYDLKTDTGKNIGNIEKEKLSWDDQEFTLRKLIRHIEQNDQEGLLREKIAAKWNDLEERASTSAGRKPKYQSGERDDDIHRDRSGEEGGAGVHNGEGSAGS